jgi:predicted ATPase
MPAFEDLVSVDRRDSSTVSVEFILDESSGGRSVLLKWEKQSQHTGRSIELDEGQSSSFVNHVKVFDLDPLHIAEPVQLQPDIELGESGEGLAGVLDNLDDSSHERFQALNAELPRWLPEYDRVKFEVTDSGTKAFSLRRKLDGLSIGSKDLSEGTLIALVLLTLAHLPNPPHVVALEHPDASIHPRLLRKVQDAIYRLAFPENHGEKRPPTQVIATTHSPYFLDLFKEHPDEVVFANKTDEGVTFQRLSDRPHIDEILPEGSLGDLWYSGLLGGVPANT